MAVELAWAIDATRTLVSVDSVPRGAACGCRCPDCGADLISKQGAKLAWHFAHEVISTCGGGGETMVHILAKKIIAAELRLRLPADYAIYVGKYYPSFNEQSALFDSAVVEEWRQGVRPDLTVQWDGGTIAVEVLVTHPCPAEKIDRCQKKGLPVVEIDLSRWNKDTFGDAEFRESVLQSADRRWLWHPAADALREKLINREIERQARVRETMNSEKLERELKRARLDAEADASIADRKARREADKREHERAAKIKAEAPMRATREVLRSNAEVALAHATARGDEAGMALVRAWFDTFEQSVP